MKRCMNLDALVLAIGWGELQVGQLTELAVQLEPLSSFSLLVDLCLGPSLHWGIQNTRNLRDPRSELIVAKLASGEALRCLIDVNDPISQAKPKKGEKLPPENDRLLKGRGEDSLPDAGVRTPRRVPNRDLRPLAAFIQRAMTTEKHSESDHTGTPSNSARQVMELPRDAGFSTKAYAGERRQKAEAPIATPIYTASTFL